MNVGGYDFSRWQCPNCLNTGGATLVSGIGTSEASIGCGRCGFQTPFDPKQIQPVKPIEHVLTAEPITAWRGWTVRRPGTFTITPENYVQVRDKVAEGSLFTARLYSIAAATDGWENPERAACLRGQFSNMSVDLITADAHEAPHRSCNCGIWGLKSEEQAVKAIRVTYGSTAAGSPAWAYGPVQMWGRFYEHRDGFRAEYARPTRIHLSVRDEQMAAELEEFYGCPVVFMDEETAKPLLAANVYVNLPFNMTTSAVSVTQAMQNLTNSIQGFSIGTVPGSHGTPSTFLESSERWNGYKASGNYPESCNSLVPSPSFGYLTTHSGGSGYGRPIVTYTGSRMTMTVTDEVHRWKRPPSTPFWVGNPNITLSLVIPALALSLMNIFIGAGVLDAVAWVVLGIALLNMLVGMWRLHRAGA